MRDCNYYYGIDLLEYHHLNYESMLLFKIIAAKQLLYKLVKIENMKEIHRINEVNSAIDFNKKLLMELGYSLATVIKKIKAFEKIIGEIKCLKC